MNRGVAYITRGVAAELLALPRNALRIALHPEGLAPRTRNLADWSGDLLAQLRREIQTTHDPDLESLYEELSRIRASARHSAAHTPPTPHEITLVHELRLDDTDLAFFGTFTTFGTARDLTLAELTILAFYPANSETALWLTTAVSETQAD
jgi:MmyB-like transcription regulator ligand binding domain